MNDPIVDEARRIRDAHAARFDYNLDAIFRDIKEQERESGFRFVAGAGRQAQPKSVSIPNGPAHAVWPGPGPIDAAPSAEHGCSLEDPGLFEAPEECLRIDC